MDIQDLLAEHLYTLTNSNAAPCCESGPLYNTKPLANFDAKKVPYISIKEYLARFAVYLKLEPSTYVVALVFIDRALQYNKGLRLTPLNIHRLLVTVITVSEKIFNDHYWRNTDYAATGAITNEELNRLELEFIAAINFDLSITENTYYEYLSKLVCQRQREVSISTCESDETTTSANDDKGMDNSGIEKEGLMVYH